MSKLTMTNGQCVVNNNWLPKNDNNFLDISESTAQEMNRTKRHSLISTFPRENSIRRTWISAHFEDEHCLRDAELTFLDAPFGTREHDELVHSETETHEGK